MNKPVTSREYKLILNPARFDRPRRATRTLWRLVRYLASLSGGRVVEQQDEVRLRSTWYCDTPGLDLRRCGYVLRVRREKGQDDGQKTHFKTTLKFRNPDRYLSAAQDLEAPPDAELKFEEDILPPFSSVFAHSAAITHPHKPELQTVRDVAALLPGLERLGVDLAAPLEPVDGFRARETCLWLGKLSFGGANVKVCLTFWHAAKNMKAGPLVVELSYDYDREAQQRGSATQPGETADTSPAAPAEQSGLSRSAQPDEAVRFDQPGILGENEIVRLEDFAPSLVEGAGRLFSLLQKQRSWIDPAGTTKTAFAYAGIGV